jgi:hypothetical protein
MEIVKTNKKRRICRWPNCTTVLSIYNMNKYCFAHGMKAAIRDDRVKAIRISEQAALRMREKNAKRGKKK